MKKLLFLFVAIAGISIYSAQAQTTDKKNAEVNAKQNVNLNQDQLKVRTVDANAPTQQQNNRTVEKNSNAAPVSGTNNSAIIREENKVIINSEPVTRTKPVKSVDRSTNTPK